MLGGRGRSIERSEVMEILDKADAANLVLQPSNSKNIAFLCLCCGCCCGILRGLQLRPKPSEVVASPFIAKLEPGMCLDCRTCLDRCQMQALAVEGDRVALNTDRCIGCGLCVSTCPSGTWSGRCARRTCRPVPGALSRPSARHPVRDPGCRLPAGGGQPMRACTGTWGAAHGWYASPP